MKNRKQVRKGRKGTRRRSMEDKKKMRREGQKEGEIEGGGTEVGGGGEGQ